MIFPGQQPPSNDKLPRKERLEVPFHHAFSPVHRMENLPSDVEVKARYKPDDLVYYRDNSK